MVLYLCVLIVFSLHRESLKLILVTDPLLRWFYHKRPVGSFCIQPAKTELDRCSRGANDKMILKMFKFKASFTLNVYQQVVSKEVIFHLIL
jgi:hypothetical protein